MRDIMADVAGWIPPQRPDRADMAGHWVALEPLDAARHAADLHRAYAPFAALWDYLPYGPFSDADAYGAWIRQITAAGDPMFYALRDCATGRCGGVASYLRIFPEAGSIEVGHICLSPEIAGKRAATEAMALMMARAFALGYRRYEWKCNAANLPSRRAAARLGFAFEGVHRQAGVVKGRNRDTAWFSVLDGEWPGVQGALAAWLDPGNFDESGQQRQSLSSLTAPLGAARDGALG
jgi:RimJ/RimL family protein N-acetyltransferase